MEKGSLPFTRLNFYPRPPRGGRPISNAAPVGVGAEFLSTPSARRATTRRPRSNPRCGISIHALREEGDHGHAAATRHLDISIHALREEGDAYVACDFGTQNAISIHALREEGDAASAAPFGGLMISIHALREEGDSSR